MIAECAKISMPNILPDMMPFHHTRYHEFHEQSTPRHLMRAMTGDDVTTPPTIYRWAHARSLFARRYAHFADDSYLAYFTAKTPEEHEPTSFAARPTLTLQAMTASNATISYLRVCTDTANYLMRLASSFAP